jgi:hypothetical protein
MVKNNKSDRFELEELQKEIDNTSKIMRLLRLCLIFKKMPKSVTFYAYQEKLENLIKRKYELLKKGNE